MQGIILMAATNLPDILDPALTRPGRFDRHVSSFEAVIVFFSPSFLREVGDILLMKCRIL